MTDRRILVTVGLWILVALLGVRFGSFLGDAATRPSNGFAAYYTAALVIRAGVNGNAVYDDDWFGARVKEVVPNVRDIYGPNPPTTALMLTPLAGRSYEAARIVWTLFNVVLLFGVVAWLARTLGLSGPWLPATFSYVLISQPVWANFEAGQVYVVLLVLLALSWAGYRQGRAAQAGVPLGLAIVFKTAGVFIPLLLLLRYRWRALAWTAGSVLVVMLVTLPRLGIDSWLSYARLLRGLGSKPELAVTAFQTQVSLVRHLLTFDAQWNPDPLVQWELLGRWLPYAGLLAMLGLTLIVARSSHSDAVLFASLLTLNIVASPLSLDYHYTLLILPMLILVAWARERGDWRVWPVLGLALALIAADLPYRSPEFANGARAVLAYPKLYGALLLWGLSLWACRRESEVLVENRVDPAWLQRQRV